METRNRTEELYKGVKNAEEQYSLWLVDRPNPVGWYDIGKSGTKAECLSYIEAIWIDMRPLSLQLLDAWGIKPDIMLGHSYLGRIVWYSTFKSE